MLDLLELESELESRERLVVGRACGLFSLLAVEITGAESTRSSG